MSVAIVGTPDIQTRTANNGNWNCTHTSTAFGADELIVVEIVGQQTVGSGGARIGFGTPSGGGLTWNPITGGPFHGAVDAMSAHVFWAYNASAQTFSVTHTVTDTSAAGGDDISVRSVMKRFSGAPSTTPIGQIDSHVVSTSDPLTSNSNLELSNVLAGSVLNVIAGDWSAAAAAAGSFDNSLADTEDMSTLESAIGTYYSFRTSSALATNLAQVRAQIDPSGTGKWAAVIYEIVSADTVPPPPVVVTVEGTGNSATSTTTLAFDCGDTFNVGDIIVVCISADNNGAAGISSLSSVADAGGNTYELLQATYDPGAAAAGQTVGIAWARVTTALVTTDDVTITFSPATVAKAAVVYRLAPDTGITLQKVTSGFTAGSATGTPTVTTATVTIGDVVIAAIAAESNAAFTQDADTTNGAWTAQTTAVGNSGTSATSSRVASQSKIVTATATQTYNPTITSCDNILGWIVFTPAFIRWDRVAVRPSQAVHRSRNW